MASEEARGPPLRDHEDDESREPLVPEGVLRGIQDVEAGNTVGKEGLEAILEF